MSLVTLAEYKEAIKETDASLDDFHQAALDAASGAVLNYADRDFGAPVVTGDKSYSYNGSGILNIDDADTVHTVTFLSGFALPNTAWLAKTEGPPQVPVYTFLELPVIDWTGGHVLDSFGAMGFTRNLDTWLSTYPAYREIQVTVNADFGWATVPDPVKRATILTARDLEEITPTTGGGGSLSAKSVADVSESFFGEPASSADSRDEALPALARALVDPYVRGQL